jgi:hypothetical protein
MQTYTYLEGFKRTCLDIFVNVLDCKNGEDVVRWLCSDKSSSEGEDIINFDLNV